MTKAMCSRAAIVTGVSVLVLCGGAFAQTGTARTPTQTDFDLCNSEAQISGMGGSASPATPGTMTTPGSVGAGSSASGSIGAGATTGGSTSGSALGSSGISAPSSVAGNPQLRGIAPSGSTNPGYQQAYRDCLTRRGF